MDDIAPGLLDQISKSFWTQYKADKKIKAIHEKVYAGTATYEEAQAFAVETGEIMSRVLQTHITADALPDGRMYYNIAERVLRSTFRDGHQAVAEVCAQVQTALNQSAGIGIKAIVPEFSEDRLMGIVNRVSAAESFDNVAWILGDPVVNFCQSVVDASVEQNAQFHYNSGLQPKVVRTSAGKCCDWCSALAGTYRYPDVPRDVYRRHENCRCLVTYNPGDGKWQNVHTKRLTTDEETAKVETRKVIGLKTNGVTVTKMSDHVTLRVAERNVKAEDLEDAINNPLHISPVKLDKEGRPSFKVVGEKATMYVNPDTGVVTTTHPTHTKTAERLKRQREGKI